MTTTPSAAPTSAAHRARPAVVCVVDDDADMRQSVVEILALAGITAEGFRSGESLQAAFATHRPDLALIDQRLPDTTGIILATGLKAEDPDLGVILLTGYASADNAIAAVGLVDDYLTKPVPPEELVRRVKAGVERTRLRRENRGLVTRLRELNSSLEVTVAERTRELEQAHRQVLRDQVVRERLQAQAERERLENRLHQAQRLESLGQLAGGVAHDFNNLLAVILTCASFVAEATEGDPGVQADVEQIRTAAEQAARLTQQLLIFGRREKGQHEALDLNEVVAEVHSLLARSIGENVHLVVHPAPGLPAIRADRSQIEQVLVNLAVNARDAMPGGGTLTIRLAETAIGQEYARLHPEVAPGQFVELSVSDTGEGMSPEVRARVFEPFFTTKPRGKGTGLGLATVHGVVTESGGSLSIYSEPGIGTTVRAFFPRTEEHLVTAANAPAPAARGRGEPILVVEDELAVLEVTARMLRRGGYLVVDAASGTEALSLAADNEFVLLLTDLVMPEISGLDLAERIKEIRPEVGVLFMSGYSQDVLGPKRVLDEGVALIQKPFTEQALLEKVGAIVAGHSRAGG